MKPAAFVYHAPDSLGEALQLLAEVGDEGKILAGGQSLVPVMNMRLSQPAELIDICRIPELAGIDVHGDLVIHAATRQAEVFGSAEVAASAPILHEALMHVGHPANRSRGTFGGSVAHADPAAELPAVVSALGGRMVVDGPRGERTVDADGFFKSYFATDVGPDEILTRVEIPSIGANRRRAWDFRELARRHGDFAMVGVAFVGEVDRDDVIETARIVLLGVGEVPERAHEAERALIGRHVGEEGLAAAAGAVAGEGLAPPSDLHASASYRLATTRVLVERAVARGLERLVD